MSAAEVRLKGHPRAFIAEEIELRPDGWVHLEGHYDESPLRWQWDDKAESVVATQRKIRRHSLDVPPSQVREVRRRG